jgi:hypothetical protein
VDERGWEAHALPGMGGEVRRSRLRDRPEQAYRHRPSPSLLIIDARRYSRGPGKGLCHVSGLGAGSDGARDQRLLD